MAITTFLILLFLCIMTVITAFPIPRLPGLYSPELCLPMTDHSYPGDPDGDLSQEVIVANWGQDTLFCKRGCCGDSKEALCCQPEAEEGLGAFELISIVAAGIAGVTVVTVASLYFIKKHNKQKVMVQDINNINKMNGKGGKGGGAGKAGKVGQYQKAPNFKNSQKEGELFKKTNTPPETKRPRPPISILSPPEIHPTFPTGLAMKPAPLDYNMPGINQTPQKPMDPPRHQQDPLISNLKAPSPPAATSKPLAPAPSPPLPENLPPPLISPPYKVSSVDDEFIDTILASIPLEDPGHMNKK